MNVDTQALANPSGLSGQVEQDMGRKLPFRNYAWIFVGKEDNPMRVFPHYVVYSLPIWTYNNWSDLWIQNGRSNM